MGGMSRPGDLLSKIGNRYALGLAVALCLGISLLLFAVLGYAAATGIASLLGGDEGAVDRWFLLTSIIWAPLSVGVVMPSIVEQFGPSIRERRETERKANLARYVERA